MSERKSFGEKLVNSICPVDPDCIARLNLENQSKTEGANKSALKKFAILMAGGDSFERTSRFPSLTEELSCLILLMPCYIINELNPAIKLVSNALDAGARTSLRINMEAEKAVYLAKHKLQKIAIEKLRKKRARDMETIRQTPYSELVRTTLELIQKHK